MLPKLTTQNLLSHLTTMFIAFSAKAYQYFLLSSGHQIKQITTEETCMMVAAFDDIECSVL
jgi:hypothetical protein